ncbi:MAG: transketolase [Rhodospirillaceae bacterium]|nr:transketolase [Rhodospirillaceae bacterium]
MANAIRALSMDAVQAANSGHPGMPMGMADVATVLFTRYLKFDPADPTWPDRDRFVLSAGHGSMLIYSLLHLTGYADMTMDEIRNFRQLGSKTAGHPEYGHAAGIETTTGPLGQGIATAVGMALAERILNARFGDVVDHHTYVIAGDGCLMEGISHEAASMAGHLKLNRLIVLFDDNQISIDGPTSLTESDDTLKRFDSYGWSTERVDGHDHEAVAAAIERAQASNQPSLIACRTIIGFGSPNKQGTAATHGAPLGADEIAAARAELNWPHEPFVLPNDVLSAWRTAGARGGSIRGAWKTSLAALSDADRNEFERRMAGDVSAVAREATAAHINALIAEPKTVATRKASELALDALTAALPEMVGGSADLTGSNNTRTKPMADIVPGSYNGTYVRYGVREHGMAAAMSGMALHGGIIPFGGTFLVFTDYCRPSIRLAALMGLRVIYVMTHDSIGLGEDGPTHQPVEHLAALRAIPNLNVFRPADVVETAECWELALAAQSTPSVIALTRQNVPQVRTAAAGGNLCERGAYVLAEADGDHQATVIASGSEIEIAMAARERLQADSIGTRVVSVPSWELLAAQDDAYRADLLNSSKALVAVEAASTFGWSQLVGDRGGVVGMTGFGASAPIASLYDHFGITADAVVAAVRERL